MTSLSPWLKPTLLGPLIVLWSLITIGAVLGSMPAIAGERLDGWLIGMLWMSFFGSGLGVLLIAVDVLLLKLKWRQLPTGGRAWISSCLTPMAVFFIWTLPFWPPPESVVGLFVFLVTPMFAAAFALRLLFSARVAAA
ncbi:MAG: hypothetical protein RLO52_16185 [Sandaracinaceae bacterium]|nr:hypothetical protein [Myxococcales bacterium]